MIKQADLAGGRTIQVGCRGEKEQECRVTALQIKGNPTLGSSVSSSLKSPASELGASESTITTGLGGALDTDADVDRRLARGARGLVAGGARWGLSVGPLSELGDRRAGGAEATSVASRLSSSLRVAGVHGMTLSAPCSRRVATSSLGGSSEIQ